MLAEILRISVFAGLLILVLLMVFQVMGQKYAPKLKYWIWLLLAVRLLVPVTITLPQQAASVPVVSHLAAVQARLDLGTTKTAEGKSTQAGPAGKADLPQTKAPAVSAAAPSVHTGTPEQPEQPKQKADPGRIFLAVWAVGAGLFLLYHIAANIAFMRRVRRWGRFPKSEEVRRLTARARKNLNIRRPLRLLILPEAGSPMVMGFLRPILLLPQEEWDGTELYYVLRHEMTHLKRQDVLYKTVLLLANAIHWFNPAVYLMRMRAYQDLEISCDAAVMDGATTTVRRQYCETIMATVQRSASLGYGMSTAFGSTKKSVMERFNEIFYKARRKNGGPMAAAVIALLVLCGCTVGMAQSGGSSETDALADRPSQVETTMPSLMDSAKESGSGNTGESGDAAKKAGKGTETPVDIVDTGNGMLHSNGMYSVLVPDSAADFHLYMDTPLMACEKDGRTLWTIEPYSVDDFLRIFPNSSFPEWDSGVLSSESYLLGMTNDRMFVLSVWDADIKVSETQTVITDFLSRNGITANPVCVTPVYTVSGAEEALARRQEDGSDEDYDVILNRVYHASDSFFSEAECRAFAKFFSQIDGFMDQYGSWDWGVSEGQDGAKELVCYGPEEEYGQGTSQWFMYKDGVVSWGPTNSYHMTEKPDTDMLSSARARFSSASNSAGVGSGVLESLAQWAFDTNGFLELNQNNDLSIEPSDTAGADIMLVARVGGTEEINSVQYFTVDGDAVTWVVPSEQSAEAPEGEVQP